MTRLGDFLEALYGPAATYRTLRAEIHQWIDLAVQEQAEIPRYAKMGRRKSPVARPESGPRTKERSFTAWVEPPSRVRLEEREENEGRTETSLTVIDGERSWYCDPQGHVEVNDGSSRQLLSWMHAQRHFDADQLREFLKGLAVECVGSVKTAGRDCLRLKATRRPGDRIWAHEPSAAAAADAYEFHADPERAVLLSISALHQGRAFEVYEVRDVAFDQPLDATLFTYTPRRGEQVRPANPVFEGMSLEGAVKRMPFTVLVPTRVPDAEHANLQVFYHHPRPRSPRPLLSLMYMGDFRAKSVLHLWIDEAASAPEDDADYEWETVEHAGCQMRISDSGGDDGMRLVRLQQCGTYVEIRSNLDRSSLLELAGSLVPASGSTVS